MFLKDFMCIFEFIYGLIKVYVINTKGKVITLSTMTCSTTADVTRPH